MRIFLNGEIRDIQEGSTVSVLLKTLGFQEEGVVVERNGDIVERSQYATTTLSENDKLELVRFVGGG